MSDIINTHENTIPSARTTLKNYHHSTQHIPVFEAVRAHPLQGQGGLALATVSTAGAVGSSVGVGGGQGALGGGGESWLGGHFTALGSGE